MLEERPVGYFKLDDVVRRVDETRSTVRNSFDIPITLFARSDVPIEAEGIQELLTFASLEGTLRDLEARERAGTIAPFFGDSQRRIASIVLTPDFHKGSGIPVGTVVDARGFVLPQAVGNDVCCGMRLLTTDIPASALEGHWGALKRRLRSLFFQGTRDIPMSPRQREAVLRDGLWGLHQTIDDNHGSGLWRGSDPRSELDDLARVHFEGVMPANDTFGFDGFIRGSGARDGRDPQIGSVGGGNHFVELQEVDAVLDGARAHAWGVTRGSLAIMVHSGSVGLGHMVGGHFGDRARAIYPKNARHPKHGFYALPTHRPHAAEAAAYLDAMRNAANFAFANRLCLGLMAIRAISETLGRTVATRLVYDAPHNLLWPTEGARLDDDAPQIHRKGATPAMGVSASAGPFAHSGHPVIIPGSMGAASYLLAGEGNGDALCSACHGAGRGLTRGRAAHVDNDVYEEAVAKLEVVTPIDPDAPSVRARRDVLAKYHQRMKEEAPYAYKPITPVVQTVEDAGIARRVARLRPLATVKG